MSEDMKIINLRLRISMIEDAADLTDEEFGRLVRYGLHFIKGDADPSFLTGPERILRGILERGIREDNERYTVRCERQRENIMKRWQKQQEQIPKNTTVYDGIPTDTKDTNTKSKSKSKSKSNLSADAERESTQRRFTPPSLSQVSADCSERNNKVDPERFISFYASKGWKVGNQPMKDWKAAVRTWELRDNPKPGADWEKQLEDWINGKD